MSRPWRIRFAGAKYHVTVRGNARQKVFHFPEDYERFLEQLTSALELDQVVLYAYALLGNHAHLFIETPLGNIHRFMQRLNTAYSMYHRYKRSRPGHCFQGRYGAKLVSGDEYILRLTRYIHLNPVKTRQASSLSSEERVERLNDYCWSSYPGYVDKAEQEEIVNYRWLELTHRRSMRQRRIAYRAYVESMVDGEDAMLKEAMAASRYAIGDEDFREQIDDELREVRQHKGAYGDIVWPQMKQHSMEFVADCVAREFKVRVEELRTHGRRAGVAKKVALELCSQYCGRSQREVGQYFGYRGNGAVGKQRAVLRALIEDSEGLRRQMTALRKTLASG